MAKEIKELDEFDGKALLIAAQKRGAEIIGKENTFQDMVTIGLADILMESSLGAEIEKIINP